MRELRFTAVISPKPGGKRKQFQICCSNNKTSSWPVAGAAPEGIACKSFLMLKVRHIQPDG